mmetsp:Transcript_16332/g.57044  ORF Transcript_16332/g.57044 Transcript_16332/m.57044 type:complete len:314 (-) Transcript_16332:109-1050(-)
MKPCPLMSEALQFQGAVQRKSSRENSRAHKLREVYVLLKSLAHQPHPVLVSEDTDAGLGPTLIERLVMHVLVVSHQLLVVAQEAGRVVQAPLGRRREAQRAPDVLVERQLVPQLARQPPRRPIRQLQQHQQARLPGVSAATYGAEELALEANVGHRQQLDDRVQNRRPKLQPTLEDDQVQEMPRERARPDGVVQHLVHILDLLRACARGPRGLFDSLLGKLEDDRPIELKSTSRPIQLARRCATSDGLLATRRGVAAPPLRIVFLGVAPTSAAASAAVPHLLGLLVDSSAPDGRAHRDGCRGGGDAGGHATES